MPPRTPPELCTKAVISIAEMAKLAGLSRNHFFALCKKGVFPMPIYCVKTRRPLFTTELQELCLAIRKTNISFSGDYVIFYQPRTISTEGLRHGGGGRSRPSRSQERLGSLASSLGQLGLVVSRDQVAQALKQLYPEGLPDDANQAIRALFSHFRRSLSR